MTYRTEIYVNKHWLSSKRLWMERMIKSSNTSIGRDFARDWSYALKTKLRNIGKPLLNFSATWLRDSVLEKNQISFYQLSPIEWPKLHMLKFVSTSLIFSRIFLDLNYTFNFSSIILVYVNSNPLLIWYSWGSKSVTHWTPGCVSWGWS